MTTPPAGGLGGASARVAGAAWLAEQAGERSDGVEQHRVDAVVLVGGAPGMELGDGGVDASVSLRDMTATPSGSWRPAPTSVNYARALVFLQAACWGLLSLLGIYWALTSKSAPPDGVVVQYHPVWAIGVAIVAAALTAAKTRLGIRISHRARGTRRTVMIVEYMMAGFAVVVCLLTLNMNGGDIPFLASLFGGPMSLIAAIRLNEPPARQYFGEPPSYITPTTPGSPHDDSQRPLFALPARS